MTFVLPLLFLGGVIQETRVKLDSGIENFIFVIDNIVLNTI